MRYLDYLLRLRDRNAMHEKEQVSLDASGF